MNSRRFEILLSITFVSECFWIERVFGRSGDILRETGRDEGWEFLTFIVKLNFLANID